MTGPAPHRAAHRVAGHRAPGAPGLALRQLSADPWASLLLAMMVAAMALVATLWPRFVLDMNSRQVPHEVSVLSAQQRDLIGVYTSTIGPTQAVPPGTMEGTWGSVIDQMERVRQAQPEPLRSLMQPGEFSVDVGQPLTPPSAEGSDIRMIELQLRVDPFLAEHVELVQGQWPELGGHPVGEPGSGPVSVTVSQEAAQRLGWAVGEVRGTAPGVRLSGTFQATDPGAPRWEHVPNAVSLGTVFDGNVGTTASAAGYLHPANPGTTGQPSPVALRFWYPLDGSAVQGDEVDLVTSQLLGLASAQLELSSQPLTGTLEAAQPVRTYLASGLVDTFAGLSSQQRATASILAVLAAGPVGVTLACFALASRLVLTRRSATLTVAAARGGSSAQLRSVLALEGLLLGLPAAALGYAAAGLVEHRCTGWSQWVVAALVGAVPAATLALSWGVASLSQGRQDLAGRSGSRVRWIVEVVVLALAAVAVWRLLDRGLTGLDVPGSTPRPSPGASPGAWADPVPVDTGVDLLITATPVLLVLAACVVTLRLYPLPVQALTHALRRRTGLTAFLGAARSVRDSAGGLMPALAVTLGAGVAVFSAVMASTITHGATSAAWAGAGAEVRLSGPRFTDELLTRIGEVDGVGAVAGVREAGFTGDLTGAGTARGVSVYIVDSTLPQVQAAAPALDPLPQALYAAGGATPVLTGGQLQTARGPGRLSTLGPVEVVGHVEDLPGARADPSFLVVDRTRWEQAGGSTPPGDVALVSVQDPARNQEVADALAGAVPNALVQTPQAALDTFVSAPVTAGLTHLFAGAVVLTTALTGLAIVLVQLIGAPARARLLAVLRTLGLARRQGQALTAWELGPLLAAALVVGAVLGLLIPWLLLRAIDLTGMTGGAAQPGLDLDWIILGLVGAGILTAVVVAVAASAAIAGNTDPSQQLRTGAER